MSSASESRSLLPIEISDSTPLTYGTSSINDDPESISRKVLEKSLLRKLDFRTVYLVLIYILNQVSGHDHCFISRRAIMTRWTGITLRKPFSKEYG